MARGQRAVVTRVEMSFHMLLLAVATLFSAPNIISTMNARISPYSTVLTPRASRRKRAAIRRRRDEKGKRARMEGDYSGPMLNDRSMNQPHRTLLVVVAAALEDDAGRVLMQQRPVEKQHGGLWEFPGGKVEAGEAPAAALARELAEELGIAIDMAATTPVAFAEDPEGPRPMILLLYRCTRWQGTVRAIEAGAIRWDVPDALADMPMPPLDIPLLAALRQARACDQAQGLA